jgi:hypothetical protein
MADHGRGLEGPEAGYGGERQHDVLHEEINV